MWDLERYKIRASLSRRNGLAPHSAALVAPQGFPPSGAFLPPTSTVFLPREAMFEGSFSSVVWVWIKHSVFFSVVRLFDGLLPLDDWSFSLVYQSFKVSIPDRYFKTVHPQGIFFIWPSQLFLIF